VIKRDPTRGNSNNQTAVATQSQLLTVPRPPEELRRAQLAVADNVNNDDRLNDGWEREADLAELLDYLGLYRRI
jgi:hypothetical protein